jgi:DNA-binding PadR family transcriptional regulator
MNIHEADYVILGFLLFRPMTGYEVKALMDRTTGHFYRPSYGGIYPGLRRLAREKLAAVSQTAAGGKIRKTYRPLPAGRKAFLAWLETPPDVTKGPGPILAKVFFWGRGDKHSAMLHAREIRRLALERRLWLEGLKKEIPAEADFYQTATCRFGIEYYRFMEKWFDGLQADV